MGATLAGQLARAGHEVAISNSRGLELTGPVRTPDPEATYSAFLDIIIRGRTAPRA
jgi:predicted dinucleotide-binding enzyme